MKYGVIIILWWWPALAGAQQFFLVRKHKKIPLQVAAPIAISTRAGETLPKAERVQYEIVSMTRDSIKIRKITATADTILDGNNSFRDLPASMDYRQGNWHRQNGRWYCVLHKILGYEYAVYAWKDIRTIYYPNKTGSGDGCTGCFFVPGLNIYYILHTIRHQKRYVIGKWLIS